MELEQLSHNKREEGYLTEDSMGEIQTYASSSGDFNLLIVLIIVGTYLLYEVGKAILDNNDDDDMDGGMMIRAADGAQA